MVDALLDADSILIVPSLPVDADCVGSAMAVFQFLTATRPGLHVEVCLDGNLQRRLEPLDPERTIVRPSQIKAQKFDAVLVLDGNALTGVGGAARYIETADVVLDLDHHAGAPTKASFQMTKGAFFSHVDPTADATAVLVHTLLEQLEERIGSKSVARALGSEGQRQISLALLAGIYTDTDRLEKAKPATKLLYQRLVDRDLGGDAAAVQEALSYRLPEEVAGLLAPEPRFLGELAGPLGQSLRMMYGLQRAPRLTISEALVGASRLCVMSVPQPLLELCIEAGRLTGHDLKLEDVRGALLDRLDQRSHSPADVSALLVGTEQGVLFSSRSLADGPACLLALFLGGGGRDGGGGRHEPIQASLEAVQERVHHWFNIHWAPLTSTVGKWRLGNF